jgi:hypothetical protein
MARIEYYVFIMILIDTIAMNAAIAHAMPK